MDSLENLAKRLVVPSPSFDVIVIGSGWSGLAAAITATQAGARVALLEASNQPGGRARSLSKRWGPQQAIIDNGQHILSGAYTHTLQLFDTVKASHTLQQHLLDIRDPHEQGLQLGSAPYPWQFIWGILRQKPTDYVNAVKLLYRLYKLHSDPRFPHQTETVEQLLIRHKIPHSATANIFAPLCLAALNTPIHQACADTFLNVIRRAFSDTNTNANIITFKTDLSASFPQHALTWLEQQRTKTYFSFRVRCITQHHGRLHIHGRYQHEDTSLTAHRVILALAPHQVQHIHLPENTLTPHQVNLKHWQWSPITTTWLAWHHDKKILNRPMIRLPSAHGFSGTGHWVFDRGILTSTPGILAVVSSGTLSCQQHQIADLVLHELREHFDTPVCHQPPAATQVITEKRATYLCTPALPRPTLFTQNPHIFLAGDFLAGPYPATLEAAVEHGIAAGKRISLS